ncbi:FAD-binding oxidoreductase [Microterricola viridarii]|uniref:FAD/FMN-containing dehydrogenase n=1 Tax=Microterricola viridarii TaxID=412690 RepID=A0A1H1LS40_9MICO|nr:FAD-binding oxidoreductase [Microterricola viridarii]SDR77444.1 FAD/FMN-containing dehydrogenase [Microterricola viridarii]
MTIEESPSSSSVTPLPAEAFAELYARIDGVVTTPGDATWDAARQAWNLSADQQPEAVVAPRTAEDVQVVIGFAEANRLRVVAQSTGHLAAPLGDLSGSILLRTAALSGIDVDSDALTVRVGAGVLWGDVTAALAEHGLMALAGSSPDVGVAGYLLGGGLSWFARSRGLATSHVTAIEVVAGDGRMLRAAADEESELFWALRGGGGNYGVVTAITMRVFAVRDAYAGMLLFPLERADEVLTAWESWARDADEAATTSIRLLRLPPLPELPEFLRGQRFIGIDGAIAVAQGAGAAAERVAAAVATLAPLRELGPMIDSFELMPAGRLGEVHMDPPGPVPGVGDGANLDELPRAAIERILELAGPDADSPLLAVEIRQIGGALAVPAADGGAVDSMPGRFLLYAVGIAPTPEVAAMVKSATTAVLDATRDWHSGVDYINFRESQVAPERLYPAATLTRLRAAKKQYDPADRIRSAHPIL